MEKNRLLEISNIVLDTSKKYIVDYDDWYDKELENELLNYWYSYLKSVGVADNIIAEYFLECAYNSLLANDEYDYYYIISRTDEYKQNPNNIKVLLDLIVTLIIWCRNN